MLPEVIVVGAMKCATSALHRYLDAHPDIAMSGTKELNFFNGPEVAPHDDEDRWWVTGQWHRGVEWYAAQFATDAPVRGESSPAYTSPSSPEVPARMARVVPGARLVYLVRDPVERAVSQWAHHRRDGTEHRPLEEALLDPGSQYVARSRYHERLAPFLPRFGADQLLVVVQERLRRAPGRELARVFSHVGVDPSRCLNDGLHHGPDDDGSDRARVDDRVRRRFRARVEDDVGRLADLIDDELAEWGSA